VVTPAAPDWVLAFLSPDDLEAISRAIAAAEAGTSGEIRVHLERTCLGDPVARAAELFEQLGMHRTALRQGVLLYLAVEDRRLAVVGDRGIHERVGETYWRALAASIAARLRGGARPVDAIASGVGEIGRTLARHFPRRPDDLNELSDRVSIR
jgi:uncharacterized membrane protein